MKTLKKVINWLLINALISGCFYHGIEHHNGLATLAQYVIWIMAILLILGVFMFVGDDDASKERRIKANEGDAFATVIPNFINLLYDLTLAGYLAYNSYVCTAFAVLVSYVCARLINLAMKEESSK
jgi:hypothetical protein